MDTHKARKYYWKNHKVSYENRDSILISRLLEGIYFNKWNDLDCFIVLIKMNVNHLEVIICNEKRLVPWNS